MNAYPKRHRHGVGLVELLIALSITSALLVATAVAVDAAIDAYAVTQSENNTLTRARVALHRLTTYIRTSESHSPYTAQKIDDFIDGQTVDDIGLQLIDENDKEITYYYNADTRKLMAVIESGEYTLLNGVLAFNVRFEPMKSTEAIKTGSGFDRLRRATITLRLTETGAAPGTARPITLSTAVVPRKNL